MSNLIAIENWEIHNNSLVRQFEFKNFIEAWAFMNKVALLAEKVNHHPDWSNSYNRVEIKLCTHSEGSTITEKDKKLAAAINKVLDI